MGNGRRYRNHLPWKKKISICGAELCFKTEQCMAYKILVPTIKVNISSSVAEVALMLLVLLGALFLCAGEILDFCRKERLMGTFA